MLHSMRLQGVTLSSGSVQATTSCKQYLLVCHHMRQLLQMNANSVKVVQH